MKTRATFSWTAPRDLFFVRPQSGSREEICERIRKDAERTLQDFPSLEGLEGYYNLSGATRFEIDGRPLPLHDWNEDEAGSGRYELRVSLEGNIENSWSSLASYNLCEMWDELEANGMSGDPDAFQIEVRYVGR